jgi:1-acyl-sn-glycerol-3-phosphate acyltransferase
MIFGEPMFFTGDSSDLLYLRDVTDQIMKRIQEMSGQEYVDIYASRRKDELRDESED